MKNIKLLLLCFLMTALGISTYAQTFTYHFVVKDQNYKEGEPVIEYFKPAECKDMVQFSFSRNSANQPYFDGENIVFPASKDGGPKGSSFIINMTDMQADYVIKDLEVIMANNTGTKVQCIVINDNKREETIDVCADAYTFTKEKIRNLTLINNGPTDFSVKEVTLTVAPYEQSDSCSIIIPYFEDFEHSVKVLGAVVPNSCWNMYHSCKQESLPNVIGLTTGASYVYDGNYELDMRQTTNCWSMAVLPAVKDETNVKDLVMDFYAEAINSKSVLEIGVLEDPNKPESFVNVETINGIDLLTTWHHVYIPFNNYTGKGKRIAIKSSNSELGSIHIDNLSVKEIGKTPSPYNVIAKNSDYKQITVDWTDMVKASSWEVEIVEYGSAPGTGKKHVVTSHPAVIDVEPGQNCYVFVKALYGTEYSPVSEPDSIHISSCEPAGACTYIVDWAGDPAIGALNNMIRIFINGMLEDYAYMPAGSSSYKTYINVCKGEELKLAFKRGTNYTKYTTFVVTNPDGEIICTCLNGVLFGKECEQGDILQYTSVDSPFLTVVAECTDCKAPTNLAASNITTTSAEISWASCPAATSWLIEYGEQGFQLGQGTQVEASTNPFLLNELIPGTDYELYVYSRCGEELSKVSRAMVFSTVADCVSPKNFIVTAISATFATFTWEAGDGETEWEFRYLAPGETEYTEAVKVTEPTITVEDLMSENEYTFQLRGLCGEGKHSVWLKKTIRTTACNEPTNVTVDNIGVTEATVSWEAVNGEKKWIVSYKDDASQWTGKIVTENSYTMTDLKPNTTYRVHIEAYCSDALTSDPSIDVFFTTKIDGIEDYLNNAVVLYPSYAEDIITIHLTGNDIHATNIELYDMQGRLMKNYAINGTDTQISVGQFAAGLYMVRIASDKGTIVKKFIKK